MFVLKENIRRFLYYYYVVAYGGHTAAVAFRSVEGG